MNNNLLNSKLEQIDNNNLEAFIPLLKAGDKAAFKVIFEAYYKRLYAFALNYVKNTYAAEDIVTQVLLKLWQKRQKIDTIKNLKSYLYTMVKNAAIDFNKKERKMIRLDVKKHDTIPLKNQFIIEEETHAILFQALERLPEKCRKVFEMSCIDGVKYKDIAEELQISINTVKSQRARAVDLLKAQLKDYPFFQVLLATC
ncbi:RNA polymerase sigma factor [Pseudotamlana carrageenivorans]|uniref:RNA polymerase sigma factor n=1 Tax=Pseudotamlana carrageenivorans TaxID=2069432 RepID=UPI0013155FD2|nr:RNA polymerase sigma-70 factor [Tamlana carrageenivorans]